MLLKTKRMAMSGLLLALTIIFLYLESILPTARLSIYALSSFMVSIITINYSHKAGWIFYIASCLLAIIVIPDKIGLIPYIAFFGAYGIIKYYIEKLGKRLPEYLLKLLFYNLVLLLGLLFMREFLLESVNFSGSLWVLVALSEIVFLIYDYVYSLFIGFYISRLSRYFKE